MTDRIAIQGLAVDSAIGVHAWERQLHRPLFLDVELLLDLRAAGASDTLADTVDYQQIADLATTVAAERPYNLIEHYAEQLAQRILMQFPLVHLELTVYKPAALPQVRTVSVHISRMRSDYPS